MGGDYPVFDICSLTTNKLSDDLFNVDRFHGYVKNNPHVQKVHKHSFYHLVLFTSGQGKHILDFETYPIKEGVIYFMRPNQAHKWIFEGEVDGYVINFSNTFFDRFSMGSSILDVFPFFSILSSNQVLELDDSSFIEAKKLFEDILSEIHKKEDQIQTPIMIIAYLLQLFVTANRSIENQPISSNVNNYNAVLLKRYLELIEENFRSMRLPKDYASMLYITSNHLNFICQEQLKTSAGELIRRRILLESQRLLVNFELSVSAIALDLNFFDTSYFVKFFKKHTGATPENFRKQYYHKPKTK